MKMILGRPFCQAAGKSFMVFQSKGKFKGAIDNKERLLVNLLEDKKYVPKFIDIAIDMMDRSLGCGPITAISQKLNVSERYFQKKFKKW